MKLYTVKFKRDGVISRTRLNMHGSSTSEAESLLRQIHPHNEIIVISVAD